MHLFSRLATFLVVGALLVATPSAFAGAATGPAAKIDKTNVELHKVRPGVWIHTSYYTYPDGTRYPSNGLIVREENHLLLVDTAWGESLTVDLLDQIKSEIGLPVHHAVVTHAHGDRLAGVDVLETRGIKVYALPLTQSRAIGEGMPVPNLTFKGLELPGDSIRFGQVEIFYPGPGHAPDNIMVWVPSQHLLFGGCAVRTAASKSLGGVADANIAAWLQAIHRVRTRYASAELVVPGHGDIGSFKTLDHTLALLKKQLKSRE